ncbi:inositol monophosphatase family protein [Rudaeicoccus suwonensis]|uniref:Fructose-1,6-bisphosphatase/inositol monophosphatase family enzyme n=1 Tax=Rudaeicoccus suwonensis TaxID=657409 RepID=A0A561DU47_9MICO|nr:inositol monophosphatase [Rudaeicoccus suwonensis]TWE06883.1 fructose-1,6-bisphosphatase/inositol monophosphatase family enzyme [Rudaeicoccus suwonensis]
MQTDQVLSLLQDVAAEVIQPRFRALADGEVMEKNPGDLVTVADREAEVAITAALRSAYPDALLVGEEAVAADASILAAASGAEHWFTIDPVDGTKNFVHGSPDHAVMVAELRGREVVRSWIWQPEHHLAYVAERGAGAFCGDRRLPVVPRNADRPLGRTSRRKLVGTAFGHLPPLELTWVSCGIDYPKLAENACEYLLYRNAMPWDHAPGQLLVSETGGQLSYSDGTAYDPTSTQGPLLAAGSSAVADRVRSAMSVASTTKDTSSTP